MSKAKKSSSAGLPGVPKGAAGRLPVARSASPARLAGRGEQNVVASVTDFGNKLEDVDEYARELIRINKEKANLDVEAAIYRDLINKAMAKVQGEESWSVRSDDDGWIATYIVPKPTRKLVPELLLAAGVKRDQLERGYKEVPAKKPYVQVRTKGEDTGSNEEHE